MGITSVSDYGIYVNIGTLVTLVLASSGIVWKFSINEKENREWTESLIENIRRDMTNNERENLGRLEVLQKETGEMGHALRTKVHEVETWSRDNFVRKESFEMVINRIEKSIDKMSDKIESKIDKLEGKIDSLPHQS